ncbi:ABC transporter substrate-binding protein [Aureimonas populi]|uniref:ABC transporter substrate-binding protein n=1 Tax=Aureimonas populi TaxID=1701758 RepID=A0ABW5CP23_9HYPH|nr:ABC transporter substrate-binding protein [Aureimonas populi]
MPVAPNFRRALLAAGALAALLPFAGIQPAGAQEVRAVMHSAIRILDPIITTAHITRNHGYMIYDTLLGMDENYQPQPQMAEWEVSEDGLVYRFTLREGLTWHDGTPVTAADCVASLERWAERDLGGQMLMEHTQSLEAEGDDVIVLTLSEPFTYVAELLAKPSSVPAFMMPARIAATPASEAIEEHVGSGPFRFMVDEFQPGVQAVYEKFEAYVPREEPASWTAGGKVVNVDRVVWVAMPDAQTSMNALMGGEIDFIEQVPLDLLPILETNPELTVSVVNELGGQTMGRMNFLHPPFDDPAIRRAALTALSQEETLAAFIGNPDYYNVCGSFYGCGTPLATEPDPSLIASGDTERARAMLEEAGYDGTPVVLLQPTDVATVSAQPVVAAQSLRAAGFNVDMQPMDWQSVVTRRASQELPANGGWNMFFTNWVVPEIWNPVVNPMLGGAGREDGWFGWPDDAALDDMRREFAAAETDEARLEIATRIQTHALENVIYVPLGEYRSPSAWTSAIGNVLPSPAPVFWNLTKSQ